MADGRALLRRSALVAFVAALVSICAGPSMAATTTYTGVYAGGTIAAGNTVVLNNGATVTGNVVANGTLQFNQSGATLTISKTISGTGTFSLTNTGAVTLSASNAYRGGTTVTSGTLIIDSAGAINHTSKPLVVGARNGEMARFNLSGGRALTATSDIGSELATYGAAGAAVVTGGTWGSATTLRVGCNGRGEVVITDGTIIASGTTDNWNSGPALVTGSSGTGNILMTGGTLSLPNGVMSVGVGTASSGSISLYGGKFGVGGTEPVFKGFSSPIYIGAGGGAGYLIVRGGTMVAPIFSYGGLLCGVGSDSIGAISVETGEISMPGVNVICGGTGGTGWVTVDGGIVRTGSFAIGVGLLGKGTLSVSGGLVDTTGTFNQWSRFLVGTDGGIGTAYIKSGTLVGNWLSAGWSGGVGNINIDGGLLELRQSAFIGGDGGYGAITVIGGTWSTAGSLVVGYIQSGTGSLAIRGGSVVVGGTLSKGGYGTIDLNTGGTLQIGAGGTTGVLNVSTLTNNGTLIFNRSNASTYSGIISGPGVISKQGVGMLTLASPNTFTGSTTIQQGALQLAHASALSASTISPLAGGVLSLTPNLQTTVGGLNPNAGGLMDVGTGMITVASGLSVADLAAALQSGRSNGSWDGTSGITSSAVAASKGSRTIGWLDNANGSVTFGYAATGDTNLDWVIDILDVANFVGSGKFNSGLTATWAEGDFNYDGFADILDMADFVSTGLFNAAPYNTPAGSIAAVPEPSTLGLVGVGIGLAGFVAMRRTQAV